jgi:predicted regulator of Ras-like GTPase activity (Roadblock/LC7/MglB family)
MTTRDGITFFGPTDVARLDMLMSGFLGETRARYVLLVDRSGQLLTAAGDVGSLDQVTFASLVAGDFAASDQLAALLGESEFSSLYHQGEGRAMFLADVGGWAILAALFDGRTTLGMVRLKSKAVVPRFARLFAELAARGPMRPTSELQNEWVAEAENHVDRLFSDG